MRYVTHVVTKRETLPQIARAYGTSVAVLSRLNGLGGGRVVAGETLRIPQASDQLPQKVLVAAARIDRPAGDAGARHGHQIVHRVRAGETLSSIARHAGMPAGTLAQLNNLNPGDTLVAGQRLVIRASARRYRDEGAPDGRRVTYTVRKGDTVYSISHQFQVTVGQLNSWNGLNRHHQIRAGQHLVMYVEQHRTQG
jgi:membrane-bound lytic murein transglycosylase D